MKSKNACHALRGPAEVISKGKWPGRGLDMKMGPRQASKHAVHQDLQAVDRAGRTDGRTGDDVALPRLLAVGR